MPTPQAAYTNSVERQGFTNARVATPDFGAAGETIGRAAQSFGQDLVKTGENLHQIQERDAETQAKQADNIRTAKRLIYLHKGPDAFYNKEGDDALHAAEHVEQDLAAIDQEAGALLKGKPLASKLFDHATATRNNDEMPSIYSHVEKQRSVSEDKHDADAFDIATEGAVAATDPTIVAKNVATAGNLAVAVNNRKGFHDDASNLLAKQKGVAKVVEKKAAALNNQSPSEALAFVNLYASQMDPNDVASLQKTLSSAADTEQSSPNLDSVMGGMKGGEVAPAAPADGSKPAKTAMPNDAALAAAQWGQESGGQHTNASGGLITSSAGALGISQTLPKTGVDPGYGVKPLQNQSKEEYIRFGNDYRRAMIKHFGGNVVEGLTAYNWGVGNVEKYLKAHKGGFASDAEFLNDIPVKEAREYAGKVLSRAGVQVAGRSGEAVAGMAPTAINGEEPAREAVRAAVMASHFTFDQKEKMLVELDRRHGAAKAAKVDAENVIKDSVAAFINTLPDPAQFTSTDQLPLGIRSQLDAHPQLKEAYIGKALTNKHEAEAAATARENAAATALDQQRGHEMSTLLYINPDGMADAKGRHIKGFKELDFTDPRVTAGMKQGTIDKFMMHQTTMKKPAEGSANYDAMRGVVKRMAGKNPPANVANAFEEANRSEEEWVRNNPGKKIDDGVREGIARAMLTKYTLVTPGGFFGDKKEIRRGYEVTPAQPGQYYQVDSFEAIKAQLQQITGRTPTDVQVKAEIQHRTTKNGLRL